MKSVPKISNYLKIFRNAELYEAQAGFNWPGEISITSDTQMTPPLWHKVKKK